MEFCLVLADAATMSRQAAVLQERPASLGKRRTAGQIQSECSACEKAVDAHQGTSNPSGKTVLGVAGRDAAWRARRIRTSPRIAASCTV